MRSTSDEAANGAIRFGLGLTVIAQQSSPNTSAGCAASTICCARLMNCAAAICCAFARQKHVTAICCCGLPTRRARSASRGGLPIPCDCHRKVLSGRPPSPPDRRPVSSEPYDVLSSHEPERRHPATHETSLPASRAIREPALYQHQEGRELVRGARPTPNCAEQNRSALARADSAEWTQKRVPHHRLPPQGSGAPRRAGPALSASPLPRPPGRGR